MARLTTKYLIDLVLWMALTPIAFWLRLEGNWNGYTAGMLFLLGVGLVPKTLVIYVLGFFRSTWRKVGVRDLTVLLIGIGAVTLVLAAAGFFAPTGWQVPRSVPLIEGLMAVVVLGGTRLAARLSHEQRAQYRARKKEDDKKVLIVGAGEAGTMLAREMQRHPGSGRHPIGFLDDDPLKQRQRFLGLRVLGEIDSLPEVVRRKKVDEVLIAIPSAPGELVRKIVGLTRRAGVDHRTIPGLYDLLSGKVSISQIREVDVEDLLRRDPVQLDSDRIEGIIRDRVVLVTGAGGSIGSEIVRQVLRFGPGRVLLLGRGEGSIYRIQMQLRRMQQEGVTPLDFHPLIGDVRDRATLEHLFATHRPDVVFHAAPHKHVPLMELNPAQAVFNNVGGTKNLVEAALAHDVERFVNISTDKAVKPTSIMGATKRVAERIVQDAARRCAAEQVFASVRFGNVLGSRGSVVPLFKRQIRSGGPVTVTHPEMKRYFMTIPEASQLVLQAASMAENGALFVLDMGEPVRIMDLARDLIVLSGFEPNVDIDIAVTGVRGGEKLFEELLTPEEGTVASRHEKLFIARKNGLDEADLSTHLGDLFTAAEAHDPVRIQSALKRLVPAYQVELPAEAALVTTDE